MTAVALSVSSMTRLDGAMRLGAEAVDRLHRLEQEAEAAFAQYVAAQERLREEGVTLDAELTPGIAAAFSQWKQNRAGDEGRRLQAADPS